MIMHGHVENFQQKRYEKRKKEKIIDYRKVPERIGDWWEMKRTNAF
jgi:hypothetical protein